MDSGARCVQLSGEPYISVDNSGKLNETLNHGKSYILHHCVVCRQIKNLTVFQFQYKKICKNIQSDLLSLQMYNGNLHVWLTYFCLLFVYLKEKDGKREKGEEGMRERKKGREGWRGGKDQFQFPSIS